jgi:hypothetical protein
MRDFLIKTLLQPFVAILFCLAFGLPFVFVGFQTVFIEGAKDQQGVVTIDFHRSHYWGVWQVDEHIENVQNAALRTSLTHRSNPRRIRMTSGVFIETETEAIRLLAGSSNVDDELKWEIVDSINDFINDPEQRQYAQTVRLANIFGWVGLPFLALGVLGVVGWPFSIVKYRREK